MVFGHSRSYIETMKRGAKPLLLIAGSLVLSATTDAITQDTTPYDSIVIRNVFNLKSPVVVPDDPIPPKDPPPTIELQGITTINGKKKVLFKVKASKPGEKDMSYILREGQGKDDVEVKLIDENAGSVLFDNHGTIRHGSWQTVQGASRDSCRRYSKTRAESSSAHHCRDGGWRWQCHDRWTRSIRSQADSQRSADAHGSGSCQFGNSPGSDREEVSATPPFSRRADCPD